MIFGIDLTLQQLQSHAGTPERAKEYGQLGYMQWLGSLPAGACYRTAALSAYAAARPLIQTNPAVAAFGHLLAASIDMPLAPLDLALPKPKRRGGAAKRRLSI